MKSSKPIGTRSLIYFWSKFLFSLNFRHTHKKQPREESQLLGWRGLVLISGRPASLSCPARVRATAVGRERRPAREVSNCGPGSRPATQPLSLSNHLRLVLISGPSCLRFRLPRFTVFWFILFLSFEGKEFTVMKIWFLVCLNLSQFVFIK